jgi:alpha-galactosidase
MQSLRVNGRDGFALLRKVLSRKGIAAPTTRLYNSEHPDLHAINLKINLFLKYGVFPYSGDRHNAEFFTEFVNRRTNKGADFGVLLTTPQERLVRWRGQARDRVNRLLSGREEIKLEISEEAASRIVTALLLDEPFHDVGNLPYHGKDLPGIPDGAVLERMVTYSGKGAVPDQVKPLPAPVMKHLRLITATIEKIVAASVDGDRALLIEALRDDLLLKNMDPRMIPELVDRLLRVHRQYVHAGFFTRRGRA